MRDPLRILAAAVRRGTPIPYAGAGRGLGSLFSGGDRQSKLRDLSQMGASGVLFAIVNATSTTTASVKWHMHREKVGAVCKCCEEEGVEQVLTHPALSVWNRPNNFFTQQELVESGQQHIELAGEGWTVMGRIGNVPSELWNARPDRIEVVTSPTKFLLGYIYHGPDGEEVPIDRKDMLFIRMPNPVDPYRGMGAVQSITRTLDSSRMSSEWNLSFFRNGALPVGIIKTKRRMQDQEWRDFQTRWAEGHQGVANAGRIGMLEGEGTEWVDVKTSQKDMQFVELAKLSNEEVMLAFRMTKFGLGIVDDINRNTAEASDAWFGKTMTVPRLDRWKGMLDNDFLPQFPGYDPRVSMVYENPVPKDKEDERADKKAKAEVYQILVDAGVHPEDAAKQAGLPPMRVVVRSEPTMQEAVA